MDLSDFYLMLQPGKEYSSLPLPFALSVSLSQPRPLVLCQVGEAGRKGDTNSVVILFGPNDFLTAEDKGVPLQ